MRRTRRDVYAILPVKGSCVDKSVTEMTGCLKLATAFIFIDITKRKKLFTIISEIAIIYYSLRATTDDQ